MDAQLCFLSRHSCTSTQFVPLPWKPSLQLHWYPPGKLLQVALSWQLLSNLAKHSLTSSRKREDKKKICRSPPVSCLWWRTTSRPQVVWVRGAPPVGLFITYLYLRLARAHAKNGKNRLLRGKLQRLHINHRLSSLISGRSARRPPTSRNGLLKQTFFEEFSSSSEKNINFGDSRKLPWEG